VTYAQRLQDLYSACLMFWMRTHTGPRFIVSSEGRVNAFKNVCWTMVEGVAIRVFNNGRGRRNSCIYNTERHASCFITDLSNGFTWMSIARKIKSKGNYYHNYNIVMTHHKRRWFFLLAVTTTLAIHANFVGFFPHIQYTILSAFVVQYRANYRVV
jgi:hypothetical protein